MKIYIAGPITGIFDYREKFKKAELKLQADGHIVISPAGLPSGLSDYMPICKAMIDQVDGIYFLQGWEKSIGSMEEYQYGIIENKKEIFSEAAE